MQHEVHLFIKEWNSRKTFSEKTGQVVLSVSEWNYRNFKYNDVCCPNSVVILKGQHWSFVILLYEYISSNFKQTVYKYWNTRRYLYKAVSVDRNKN